MAHSYCLSCESELDGDCVSISDRESLTKQCEGTYPYDKRGCYTLVTQGETVTRGCIKDLSDDDYEYCQKNGGDSKLCLENGCNDQNAIEDAIDRYCYVCDSETDLNCIASLDDSLLRKCPANREDLGCFHKITGMRKPILNISARK